MRRERVRVLGHERAVAVEVHVEPQPVRREAPEGQRRRVRAHAEPQPAVGVVQVAHVRELGHEPRAVAPRLDHAPALREHVAAVLVQEGAREPEPHGHLVGRLEREQVHRRVAQRVVAPRVEGERRVEGADGAARGHEPAVDVHKRQRRVARHDLQRRGRRLGEAKVRGRDPVGRAGEQREHAVQPGEVRRVALRVRGLVVLEDEARVREPLLRAALEHREHDVLARLRVAARRVEVLALHALALVHARREERERLAAGRLHGADVEQHLEPLHRRAHVQEDHRVVGAPREPQARGALHLAKRRVGRGRADERREAGEQDRRQRGEEGAADGVARAPHLGLAPQPLGAALRRLRRRLGEGGVRRPLHLARRACPLLRGRARATYQKAHARTHARTRTRARARARPLAR